MIQVLDIVKKFGENETRNEQRLIVELVVQRLIVDLVVQRLDVDLVVQRLIVDLVVVV